jgi:hypothetical protein
MLWFSSAAISDFLHAFYMSNAIGDRLKASAIDALAKPYPSNRNFPDTLSRHDAR